MKNYIRLILVLLVFVFCNSCDDALDTESKSTFTEQTVFNNIDFAKKAVLGVYARMVDGNGYEGMVGLYYNCDNDIECMPGNDDGGRRSLTRYIGTDGNSATAGPWTSLYQNIERANICIDNLYEGPLWNGESAAEARKLYGEAITLRALFYFDLMRFFGDVPWMGHSFQDGDPFYVKKTDRDSIYEVLIEQLKDVEQYVPWMNELQTTERIGKGYVKGLRARMALTYAGWSLRNGAPHETRKGRKADVYYKIAHDECEELMQSGQHRMNPDYVSIFKTLHAYNMDLTYGEILFEIAYGRGSSGNVCMSIGMAFASNPADPRYGKSSAEVGSSPYYFYSFDRKDIRRNVALELYNYGSTSYSGQQRLINAHGNQFRISKWRKSWIVPAMGGVDKETGKSGVNWPMMRYTDVALMFAETENELNNGPTQAAKDVLTAVRERAFPPAVHDQKVKRYVDSVSVTKADFFNAIVDERAWELGGEMIRKNDLVRWNLLANRLTRCKEINNKIIDNDPAWQWVPNYIFWKTNPDGETLDILNQDFRMPSSPTPAGYTRTAFFSTVSDANKNAFREYVANIARGYAESINNHLFPLSINTITDSNGYLDNDQMPPMPQVP